MFTITKTELDFYLRYLGTFDLHFGSGSIVVIFSSGCKCHFFNVLSITMQISEVKLTWGLYNFENDL
ncbi:hypothetical protein B0A80_19425 [Flavobacterium tructae]|nr:hypothetical protein B0A80_19425 [Flavobacterium tructae]